MQHTHQRDGSHYGRLLAMTVLSFIAMYVLMYAMVDRFANVYPNVNQFYMAGLMTAAMILIELLVMSGMYRNRKLNALLVAASVIGLAAFWILIRRQSAVSDRQFLKSMIPHHGGAILMCSEASIKDAEIQTLCRQIVVGQQQEIDTLPAAWEIDHLDPAYAAAAKEVFDRWNQYIDVFVYRAGDGVAAPNGKNELVFLDIAAASKAYGINMDRDTFAVTYMSPISAAGEFDACPKPPQTSCGTFTETDVIVNADFLRGFKPSGAVDFSDRGPALYAGTVAHELGHTLGFHHNVNNISVMNLYEDFAAQFIAASDTQEARAAYPAQARTITDMAIYPFHFDPELTDYAATTPVDVSLTGGTITIRNDARAGVSFPMPRDVPPGVYFVGAQITDVRGTADPVAYNNSWVAPQPISIGSAVRRRAARH